MTYAFIIMGDFNYIADHAAIHNGTAQIIGVSNLSEACSIAEQLWKNGVDCIELCGAFGEKGAEMVIKATHNEIPVGYVTHLPKQDKLYFSVFGDK